MKPTNVASTVILSTGKNICAYVRFNIEKELNLPPQDGTKKTVDKREKLLRILERKIEEAVAEIEIDPDLKGT